MKKYFRMAIIGSILFFIFNVIAFGADSDYRFMRNDHDTLLIGEIISMDENTIVIQAIDYIVSAHDLNQGASERQLRPETASVIRTEQMNDFHVGDYVLASLNQEGDLFVVAWGIYRMDLVDELDWQIWYVETGSTMHSAMFSDFVNQEGRYTYSVRDGRVLRHQGDADIVIYDLNPPQEIQPRTETDDELEEGESSNRLIYAILGGSALVLVALVGRMLYNKSRNNTNV